MFASASMASMVLSDDFEAYADQAALDAVYPAVTAPNTIRLDQVNGYSGSQSITAGSHEAVPHYRSYINLGGSYSGTDEKPLKFEFQMAMSAADDWWTRDYIEIRSYSDGAFAQGTLQQLIAIGATSSGVTDTSLYSARVLYGGDAWFNLPVAKNADWTKLTAMIKTSTVDFYVDDSWVYTSNRTAGTPFDSLAIGAGVSSRVQVWFDDLKVEAIPEPATMTLIGLAGVALVLRRRR